VNTHPQEVRQHLSVIVENNVIQKLFFQASSILVPHHHPSGVNIIKLFISFSAVVKQKKLESKFFQDDIITEHITVPLFMVRLLGPYSQLFLFS
jgi:hypothetical protein